MQRLPITNMHRVLLQMHNQVGKANGMSQPRHSVPLSRPPCMVDASLESHVFEQLPEDASEFLAQELSELQLADRVRLQSFGKEHVQS